MPRAERRKRKKEEERKAIASKMSKLTAFFPRASDNATKSSSGSVNQTVEENEPGISFPNVTTGSDFETSEAGGERQELTEIPSDTTEVCQDVEKRQPDVTLALEESSAIHERSEIEENHSTETDILSESFSELPEESNEPTIENTTNLTDNTMAKTTITSRSESTSLGREQEQPYISTEMIPDEIEEVTNDEPSNQDQPISCPEKCCRENRPYHPTAEEIKSYSTMQAIPNSERVRMCPSSTFKRYPWISFCISRGNILCYHCTRGMKNNLVTFSKCGDDAFTSGNFCNWKKCFEKIEKHSKSKFHEEAVTKVGYLANPKIDIAATMKSDLLKTRETRRAMLIKQISSLRFLARQGLGIRGHLETELEGNLRQLLLTRSEDVPELKEWIQQGHYQSHDVINELIEMMGNTVLRSVLQNVRISRLFSLVADESRDISNKEQLTCILKWMDYEDMSVKEDFIGMYQLEKADAQTVASALKDIIIRCNLNLENCMWQGYDGAATMAGSKSGVAKRMQECCPSALFLHCANHSLDLALQSLARESRLIRNTLDYVQELATFIKASPKRMAQYHNIAAEYTDAEDLHKVCPTRWTIRTKAICSVLRSREALSHTLKVIAGESTTSDIRDTAAGLETGLNTFDLVFGLHLAKNIFSVCEQVGTTLQKPTITAQTTLTCVKTLITSLQAQRKAFDLVFDKAQNDSIAEPSLPRQRKTPRRLQHGSAEEHTFGTAKEYYKIKYYQAIDECSTRINERFDQPAYAVLNEIEDVLLKAANGSQDCSISTRLQELYSKDIDCDMIEGELKLLGGLVLQVLPDIKAITDMDTLVTVIKDHHAGQILTNVKKLMQIYLLAPMSAALAERSFSVQRLLKTHLRSTMTEERYNNLLILHVHKSRTDNIDTTAIANEFIHRNNRRLQFFGK